VKILFVANRMPYPPYRGDKLKIFNLASQLCKNHELHLITVAENAEDLQSAKFLQNHTHSFIEDGATITKPLFHSISYVYRPKWKSVWSALVGLFQSRPIQVAFFRSSAYAEKLKHLLETTHFDAIHVQHLRMSQYFENGAPKQAILDLPDAFSMYWKRRMEAAKTPWDRLFRKIEFQRMAQYEQRMLPLFSRSLVCSQEDRKYLMAMGIQNVELLPNGVNIDSFSPQGSTGIVANRILFTGNMDYAPNIDAVQYFVTEILPLVLEKNPAVEFVVAGQRPVKAVLDLASDRVKITGFIPNLADEYAKAHVVVSPLRIGAGTQNKVLEALAMHQAVVCSQVGFAGLGLENGKGILMADNPQEFAQHVLNVLANESLRTELGETGGKHVRETFAWSAVANQLIQHFEKIQS
jgi:polysaccharide biosynthesis protein PslH